MRNQVALLVVMSFMLLACQANNLAGKPGYQPDNCGMVGSSCERD